MRILLISCMMIFCSKVLWAQMDPSSAVLLNGGSHPTVRDNGLDSGRYTVRPKSDSGRKDDGGKSTKKLPTVTNPEVLPVATPSSSSDQVETSTSESDARPAASADAVATPNATDVVVPNATPSNALDILDERRFNLIDLSVAPGYLYTSSDSSYFYRRYFSSSPSVGVQAKVWLTPEFALNAEFLSSMSGHVNDSTDGSRRAAVSQQWLNLGVRSRKFFGNEKMSPSLTVGLDYYDYQFRVPSDAIARARLGTTGVLLSVESELPAERNRFWTFSFQMGPKLQHREDITGIDFQSGGSVDTTLVGLSVGHRYQFDRTHSIFWKLSHSIEKNLFSGDATRSDPETGVTPSGVDVTQSFTIFQFGYAWGK